MKKVIMCMLLSLFLATPVLAYVDNDISITKEALMNMSDVQRNAVFEGIKKQAELQKKPSIDKDAVKIIADMDIETFKGKAVAIADTMVIFCDKIGVSVNQFITTPVGTMATISIIYKMGIFGSIWSSVGGIFGFAFFSLVLYKLNTKKIVKLKKYNKSNEIVGEEEILVPKLSAVFTSNTAEQTIYSVVGSLICIVAIISCLVNIF